MSKSGELTKGEKGKVFDWVTKQSPKGIGCAICAKREWILGDHLVAAPIFHEGNMVLGGQSYPTVMLICKNCGHTLYLNAVMIGLVPPKKKQDPKDEVVNG